MNCRAAVTMECPEEATGTVNLNMDGVDTGTYPACQNHIEMMVKAAGSSRRAFGQRTVTYTVTWNGPMPA